jgi:hypothetical protein
MCRGMGGVMGVWYENVIGQKNVLTALPPHPPLPSHTTQVEAPPQLRYSSITQLIINQQQSVMPRVMDSPPSKPLSTSPI